MNRIDRIVAAVLLLQSRGLIRAQDIAEHFEISKRTVYRDLRTLEEAGEGYSLVPGYHLPPVMFTHEEASALFVSPDTPRLKSLLCENATNKADRARSRIRFVRFIHKRAIFAALLNAFLKIPKNESGARALENAAACRDVYLLNTSRLPRCPLAVCFLPN